MLFDFLSSGTNNNPVDDLPDTSSSAYPDSDCIDSNLIGYGGIDASAGFKGCSI
jgi:hypothetical protein